mmetsp:Transcript_10990/g.18231  ORF Transcript_10990/g.18231 Transcript_10990/m.18231 type:complete len:81 (-) Transcript_10990:108-350(-)
MKKISPNTTEELLEEKMSTLKETLLATEPQCSGGDETTNVENETDSDSNEGYEYKESTVHEASHKMKTSTKQVKRSERNA